MPNNHSTVSKHWRAEGPPGAECDQDGTWIGWRVTSVWMKWNLNCHDKRDDWLMEDKIALTERVKGPWLAGVDRKMEKREGECEGGQNNKSGECPLSFICSHWICTVYIYDQVTNIKPGFIFMKTQWALCWELFSAAHWWLINDCGSWVVAGSPRLSLWRDMLLFQALTHSNTW